LESGAVHGRRQIRTLLVGRHGAVIQY
jgi:hypothetical protein